MYCTVADMVARFGEQEIINLTSPGQAIIDETVLDQAMIDAGSLIDSYLGSRYKLPLTTVPTVLARTACSVARYYLYNDQMTESVEKAHKDAIKYLADVSKGIVQLGVSTTGERANQSESLSQMTSSKPVWDRRRSKGFI
ncbi:MAG: DUF1320 domain-containing protein [Gammaproteobacteria bacterium]|nr:DUF1320 domain-containing protein [Gammaproteobacteria bacterium]